MSSDEFKISARISPGLNQRIDGLVAEKDYIYNKTDFVIKALTNYCEEVENEISWKETVEKRLQLLMDWVTGKIPVQELTEYIKEVLKEIEL